MDINGLVIGIIGIAIGSWWAGDGFVGDSDFEQFPIYINMWGGYANQIFLA